MSKLLLAKQFFDRIESKYANPVLYYRVSGPKDKNILEYFSYFSFNFDEYISDEAHYTLYELSNFSTTKFSKYTTRSYTQVKSDILRHALTNNNDSLGVRFMNELTDLNVRNFGVTHD